MKLGFTGSRDGMTMGQVERFAAELKMLPSLEEFHHGDCIGADEQAAAMVKRYHPSCKIVIHPPDNSINRAYCHGDDIREEKSYLARNRDIVDESSNMIATPPTREELVRSGTWSTIRYARRTGKHPQILIP